NHIITKTHWWFTTPFKQKIGAKRVNNKKQKTTECIKGSEKITQKLENLKEEDPKIELIIFSIDRVKIIQDRLKLLYSEDPLKEWEKHKTKNLLI
ncbi:hypothetical protein MTR67_007015, partial [Solanum verrucosum]